MLPHSGYKIEYSRARGLGWGWLDNLLFVWTTNLLCLLMNNRASERQSPSQEL